LKDDVARTLPAVRTARRKASQPTRSDQIFEERKAERTSMSSTDFAQTLALFVKVIRKLTKALQELLKDDVARTLPSEPGGRQVSRLAQIRSSKRGKLNVPRCPRQTCAADLFVKVIRKLTKALQELLKDDVARTLPSEDAAAAAADLALLIPQLLEHLVALGLELLGDRSLVRELSRNARSLLPSVSPWHQLLV
jgi:hypothetical protein